MEIQTILPSKITDNDTHYFEWLLTAIEYSCPDTEVQIASSQEGYMVHITPSDLELRQPIIDNVLNIHRRLKTKITFSKSLRLSKKVSFFVQKS